MRGLGLKGVVRGGFHLCQTWQGFAYVAFVIELHRRLESVVVRAYRLCARCAGAGTA